MFALAYAEPVADALRDSPCAACCDWREPFAGPARVTPFATVAMTYAEWMLYTLHVVQHQRGCPVA